MTAKSGDKQVGIEFMASEGLLAQFADRMTVSVGEETLVAHFYQVDSPVIRSDEDVKRVDSVKAYCFAKVMLTPQRAKEIIRDISAAVKAFETREKGKEAG